MHNLCMYTPTLVVHTLTPNIDIWKVLNEILFSLQCLWQVKIFEGESWLFGGEVSPLPHYIDP